MVREVLPMITESSLFNARIFKLHKRQKEIYDDPSRFKVSVCGRRFGKTVCAKALLIKYAIKKKKALVWYVAPTYAMARDIMWPELTEAIPKNLIFKKLENRLELQLINGSLIKLYGADSPENLRGRGVDFVVLDEFQDFKLGIWDNVIYPTLTDKYGHALIIGTPKLHGELKDLYYRAIDPENASSWRGWQIPTSQSPFIPKSELVEAKKNMDEKAYKREFEASLEDGQGRIYYNFNRVTHVKPLKPLDLNKPLYIGVDFNVDPMTAIIFQLELSPDYKYGSKDGYWVMHVKDEITLSNSNVSELCDEIDRRYYRWGAPKIGIYPDPAGKARTQTRGESNFQIFKQRGFTKLFARSKHPAREDRFAAVNFMLKDATGKVRMLIDPKCKNLIKSLEQTIYKPGTNDMDKSAGIDHWTDALGYPTEFMFPVRTIKIMGVSI